MALVSPDEVDKLRAVEKLIRQAIPAEDLRQDKSAPLNRPRQGGRRRRGRERQRGGGRRRGGAGRQGGGPSSQHRPRLGASGHRSDGGNRDGHRAGARGGDGRRRREAAPADAAGAPSRGDRQAWRDADFRDGTPEPRGGRGAGTGQAAR